MLRDLIVLAAVFGGLPYAFSRPYFGLLMFSWLAYMRPQDLCWGPARGQRFSLFIGVAMMLGWIVYEKRPFTRSFPARKWLIGLFAMITLSMFINELTRPDKQITKWMDLVKVFAVALFTVGMVDTKHRLHTIVWVIALSLGFYGIKGGLFGIFTGGRILQGPGGMLKDNNDLCMAMGMILPFWFYPGRALTNRRNRRLCMIACFLIVVTIIITTSRGGFLTLCGALGLMVLKSRHRFLGIGAGLVVAMALIVFMPSDMRERLETLKDPTKEGSAAGRLHAWNVALNMAAANPMLGVGYLNFTIRFRMYDPTPASEWQTGKKEKSIRVAHNSYLQLLAESGGPALFCFLAMMGSTFLLMRKLRRINRIRAGPLWIDNYTNMVEVSLAAFCMGGMFLNRAHFDLLYHVVALGACIYLVGMAELREIARHQDELRAKESFDLRPAGSY